MTQQLAVNQTDTAPTPELAQPVAQQINIYGHSNLLYWWPAWAFGYIFALLNAGQEQFLATAEGCSAEFSARSHVRVDYITVDRFH